MYTGTETAVYSVVYMTYIDRGTVMFVRVKNGIRIRGRSQLCASGEVSRDFLRQAVHASDSPLSSSPPLSLFTSLSVPSPSQLCLSQSVVLCTYIPLCTKI